MRSAVKCRAAFARGVGQTLHARGRSIVGCLVFWVESACTRAQRRATGDWSGGRARDKRVAHHYRSAAPSRKMHKEKKQAHSAAQQEHSVGLLLPKTLPETLLSLLGRFSLFIAYEK